MRGLHVWLVVNLAEYEHISRLDQFYIYEMSKVGEHNTNDSKTTDVETMTT